MLDGPHRNMLTLRAHLSLKVSTYLLHKQLLDCSTTYTTTPRQPCTLHLMAYVRAHLLACLLTYLPNFIISYLLTYLLSPRANPNSTTAYLDTSVHTDLLTYLLGGVPGGLEAQLLIWLHVHCWDSTADAACRLQDTGSLAGPHRHSIHASRNRHPVNPMECTRNDRTWKTQPSAPKYGLTYLPAYSLFNLVTR